MTLIEVYELGVGGGGRAVLGGGGPCWEGNGLALGHALPQPLNTATARHTRGVLAAGAQQVAPHTQTSLVYGSWVAQSGQIDFVSNSFA